MAAKVTERVNALNGETGQVLHLRFSLSCAAQRKKPSARKKPTNVARLLRRGDCGVKEKQHKM
jgi:hypothetical protein